MSVSEPYWASEDGDVVLHLGRCEKVLRGLPAESVDAIVTDPPAAISFMGRDWDGNLGGRGKWVAWLTECMAEAYRVLKPGGHALVWSIPRTSHWTAWAIEDAGFDLRDCVLHLFGSGFPKNPNALKPGQEMWWLARKPFRGSVAANVLEFGTGALNVDGCRVSAAGRPLRESRNEASVSTFGDGLNGSRAVGTTDIGRWPANIVLTHSAACEMTGTRRVKGITGGTGHHKRAIYSNGLSATEGVPVKDYADADGMETVEAWSCAPDCPVGELDRQSGNRPLGGTTRRKVASSADRDGNRSAALGEESRPLGDTFEGYSDTGGASRFYPVFRYQAKAPASERPRLGDGTAHETVKPLGLISWLVRLITPPGGTVLDMFAGSGPVAEACIVEGFWCVLIEQDPKSAALIMARLSKPIQPVMFGLG